MRKRKLTLNGPDRFQGRFEYGNFVVPLLLMLHSFTVPIDPVKSQLAVGTVGAFEWRSLEKMRLIIVKSIPLRIVAAKLESRQTRPRRTSLAGGQGQ